MRIFVLLILCLVGLAGPLRADNIAAAQSVIRSQNEAFSRDDASAAYAFAAPALQQVFAQPETFMTMVRERYAAVYRHRSFEFGDARVADGKIALRALIVDASGEPWEALYTLEQQSDGSLKITGCMLLKSIGA